MDQTKFKGVTTQNWYGIDQEYIDQLIDSMSPRQYISSPKTRFLYKTLIQKVFRRNTGSINGMFVELFTYTNRSLRGNYGV